MRQVIAVISRALLGKTLEEAKEIAADNNMLLKVVEDNNDSLIIGKKNRILVVVNNGKIIKVVGVG